MSINKEKKTNFPDLERLPNTNFWRHLFNYWWNKPRIFAEEILDKYIFQQFDSFLFILFQALMILE